MIVYNWHKYIKNTKISSKTYELLIMIENWYVIEEGKLSQNCKAAWKSESWRIGWATSLVVKALQALLGSSLARCTFLSFAEDDCVGHKHSSEGVGPKTCLQPEETRRNRDNMMASRGRFTEWIEGNYHCREEVEISPQLEI